MRLAVMLLPVLLLAAPHRLQAQGADENEKYFLRNNGLNVGWNVFQPTWPTMDGLVAQFNSEAGFQHSQMSAETPGQGLVIGFSFFPTRHTAFDLEYRGQRVDTKEVTLRKLPTDAEATCQVRMYQHSARFSLNFGTTFGRYGTTGIYLGAAFYGGSWDLKYKSNTQSGWARQTSDDFTGFTAGISPQLIFRTYLLELKAYYDVPFLRTDFAPAYNDVFRDYNVNAPADGAMKGWNRSLGVAATLCIPVFRSEAQRQAAAARRAAEGAAGPDPGGAPDDFKNKLEQQRRESQDRIQQMRDQQYRDEQKSNERQHERERRGY